MSAMTVYLPEIADVADFVNIMTSFPFEAQLHVGSYAVDAKSIMGIFTLDREQPVLLEAETADAAQLERLHTALAKYLTQPVH